MFLDPYEVVHAFRAKMYLKDSSGVSGTTAEGVAGALAAAANELRFLKDLTIKMTAVETDLSIRASEWKLYGASLLDGALNGQILYLPKHPLFKLLHTALKTRAPVAGFASDGLGNGLVADWAVVDLSNPQRLAGEVVCDFVMKPTFHSRLLNVPDGQKYPDWVEGIGGSEESGG